RKDDQRHSPLVAGGRQNGYYRKFRWVRRFSMAYTLDSLAAFVETCGSGSFSAAARRLGKSQSTISEAIANLEIDVGVALFDRSHRQPVLTEAGQALLAQAREVLAASERFGRTASQLSGGQEPRLTVA